VLVTPALYLPLLLVGHVANALGWLPPAWWQALLAAAHLLPDTWAQLGGDPAPVRWGFLALLLVVPGALVMLGAWLGLRVALRESWVGGARRRLRARRPDPAVLDERRLANLAEEIAVAAAVPPPRVLVADLPSANAIVLGRDVGDATIVLTRGLLDTLGRAEQQAVQPDPEDRLARLRALGAVSAEVPVAARTPRDTLADVRTVVLWGVAAVALCALLLAIDLVTTAALLWLVWALLAFVFVTLPGRVVRLVG